MSGSESGDELLSQDDSESLLSKCYEEFYHLLVSTWNKVSITTEKNIYAKPWYLFLGDKNSGKSNIIDRSNLTFERVEEVGLINEKIKNIKGPVQYYLSREAVIVEKKVRNNDDNIWLSFIKWLSYRRENKPLNGLILSVDIESLINSTVNERKLLAKKIARELISLNDLLGLRLPVYLVITKLDLLQGFMEFYENDSTKNYEELLFCFTFPLDGEYGKSKDINILNIFSTQYDSLIKRLNNALQEKIIDDSVSDDVYFFVRQMIGFKSILHLFLSEIFKESAHSTYPLLRSIFFTSSEQQSLPFNAVAENVSNFFDMPGVIYSRRKGYSKDFFIKNIFSKKILPESGLVSDNFYVQKRLLKNHILQYAICGLLVIFVSSAWTYYYQSNRQSASNVLSVLESYSDFERGDFFSSPEKYLKALNTMRGALDEYSAGYKRSNIFSDFGLYKGDLIRPSLEKTYNQLISDGFFKSIISRILSYRAYGGDNNSLKKLK